MYCGEGVVPADCFDDSTMIMLPAALLVLMLIPACVIRCATRGNESKRRRGADVPIEERQLLSTAFYFLFFFFFFFCLCNFFFSRLDSRVTARVAPLALRCAGSRA